VIAFAIVALLLLIGVCLLYMDNSFGLFVLVGLLMVVAFLIGVATGYTLAVGEAPVNHRTGLGVIVQRI
jgi:hypothetical protein